MHWKRLKRYNAGEKKLDTEFSDYESAVMIFNVKNTMKNDGVKKKRHLAQNKACFISHETLLRDTLVIVQRGGWLQRYLQCGPPTEESQRATKWPTEKIWHCKWVFFLVSNSPSIFLPFSVTYNFSRRTNSSLSSSFSPQCLFFFLRCCNASFWDTETGVNPTFTSTQSGKFPTWQPSSWQAVWTLKTASSCHESAKDCRRFRIRRLTKLDRTKI